MKNIRSSIFKVLVAILACTMLIVFSACTEDDSQSTEILPRLDGVYTSEYGTFYFKGDGNSILIDINEEFSQMTGLPVGQKLGEYAFCIDNHGLTDYDKANILNIYINDVEYTLSNSLDAENKTSEDAIVIQIVSSEEIQYIRFEKEK